MSTLLINKCTDGCNEGNNDQCDYCARVERLQELRKQKIASMEAEEVEINNRLSWYMDTYYPDDGDNKEKDFSSSEEEKEEDELREEDMFDPIIYLTGISDMIANVPLYVCQRELICVCDNEQKCTCDSDIFHQICSSSLQIGSNCKYLCEFVLKARPSKKNRLSRRKIIRFFIMEGNEEKPILDIIASQNLIVCYNKQGREMLFNLSEKVTVHDRVISFKFDYMSYDYLK
jgi:hypothetical protein